MSVMFRDHLVDLLYIVHLDAIFVYVSLPPLVYLGLFTDCLTSMMVLF